MELMRSDESSMNRAKRMPGSCPTDDAPRSGEVTSHLRRNRFWQDIFFQIEVFLARDLKETHTKTRRHEVGSRPESPRKGTKSAKQQVSQKDTKVAKKEFGPEPTKDEDD